MKEIKEAIGLFMMRVSIILIEWRERSRQKGHYGGGP
jgi:hypothetical protein